MKKAGRGMQKQRKSLVYSRLRVKKNTCMTEGEVGEGWGWGGGGAIVPFRYEPIKLSEHLGFIV